MKLLLIVLTFAYGTHGWSGGDFQGADAKWVCEKQIPGGENGLHGPNKVTEKEDIDPPFLMNAVKADAGFVLVNVGVDTARFPDKKFKGLFMMAEALGDRGYGYFIPLEDSKDLITPFDCEDLPNCQDDAECQGTANAIRHTSPDLKTNVTALWFPPSDMSGTEVTFVATVVETKANWYENLSTLPIVV